MVDTPEIRQKLRRAHARISSTVDAIRRKAERGNEDLDDLKTISRSFKAYVVRQRPIKVKNAIAACEREYSDLVHNAT